MVGQIPRTRDLGLTVKPTRQNRLDQIQLVRLGRFLGVGLQFLFYFIVGWVGLGKKKFTNSPNPI